VDRAESAVTMSPPPVIGGQDPSCAAPCPPGARLPTMGSADHLRSANPVPSSGDQFREHHQFRGHHTQLRTSSGDTQFRGHHTQLRDA
jgi:hypothetical protein